MRSPSRSCISIRPDNIPMPPLLFVTLPIVVRIGGREGLCLLGGGCRVSWLRRHLRHPPAAWLYCLLPTVSCCRCPVAFPLSSVPYPPCLSSYACHRGRHFHLVPRWNARRIWNRITVLYLVVVSSGFCDRCAIHSRCTTSFPRVRMLQ